MTLGFTVDYERPDLAKRETNSLILSLPLRVLLQVELPGRRRRAAPMLYSFPPESEHRHQCSAQISVVIVSVRREMKGVNAGSGVRIAQLPGSQRYSF